MGSKPQLLQKVISLCRRRGFFFQALPSKDEKKEERYVLGPLGAELKRNLINEWWYSVITSNELVYALNTSSQCDSSLEKEICESSGGDLPKYELWKGVLTHLPDCVKYMGLKLPFGLAEIGKEYRRDYSSKLFILKSPEYDSFGLQFFSPQDEHRQWYSYWQKQRLHWWKKFANHPERFNLGEGEGKGLQQRETAVNHGEQYMYSTIQFEFPWGAHDLETFTKLGEPFFQEVSQQTMTSAANGNSKESAMKIARVKGKRAFPHLISLSGDIDGALLAYLCDAYTESNRTIELKALPILRLHRNLSPYKVAILPQDSANEKLLKYCRKLSSELMLAGIPTMCSFTGSLEERLQIHNEMGTPYRVVADAGMLESGVVGLQDRDTTIQEEMNGNDILPTMLKFLSRELS